MQRGVALRADNQEATVWSRLIILPVKLLARRAAPLDADNIFSLMKGKLINLKKAINENDFSIST